MTIQKIALISGSTRGIGKVLAQRLTALDYNVIITGKTKTDNPNYYHLDLKNRFSIDECVSNVVKKYGKIDLLINNASYLYLGNVKNNKSLDYYNLVHSINSRGTYYLSKLCLPYMPEYSRIITHSPPIQGEYMDRYIQNGFFSGKIAYITSKLNMSMITLGLAVELKERGISANCIWPETAIHTDAIKKLAKKNPALNDPRLWRRPDILADMVSHLIKEPIDFTGNCLIDSDYLMTKGVFDFSIYNYTDTKFNPPPLINLL